ncbi:ABC transporter permease, partial [Rhodococcus sp. IEGM 1379]|uniref:ABC transporter permease n=1 Tax=Rhodococcus sp. IEGM 1379 TaxID=3047086 RepID=UPI0024B74C2A
GACVGNRAGAFNIGQEGQVLIGAMLAVFVGLRMPGPPILVITISAVAGAVAGGLWAGVSSFLHRIRGVNVVVSTLLMSFIAVQLVSYVVSVPWLLQEPKTDASSTAANQSAIIPDDYRLPSFGQYPNLSINIGLIIAIVLTVVVALLLARSRWGFTIGMVGRNPLTAQHAGVRVALVSAAALMVSGACAGLAGAVVVEGAVYRLQPAVSNNFGWDGLLVALIARNRPMLAIPVAIVFGALRTGSAFLAATGVPVYLVNVVQSLLVFACVIAPALTFAQARLSKNAQETS